jgi:hypothetical protein
MTTVRNRWITKKQDVMADMQEGNTNIPEFTGKASTCRLWFKTKLFTDFVPTQTSKMAGSISI